MVAGMAHDGVNYRAARIQLGIFMSRHITALHRKLRFRSLLGCLLWNKTCASGPLKSHTFEKRSRLLARL